MGGGDGKDLLRLEGRGVTASSRLLINFPQGKAQHMGGDIRRPQQMAEEPVSHWEGVSSQGSGHSLGLLGWQRPQGPPVSRSPSPSGEEAPF